MSEQQLDIEYEKIPLIDTVETIKQNAYVAVEKWFVRDLLSLLSQQVVEVGFIKKDKSVRMMRCTTNPEIIANYLPPVEKENGDEKPKAARTSPYNLLRVFDTDAKDFRSFSIGQVFVYDGKVVEKMLLDEIFIGVSLDESAS